jgi:hypothetical protein
MAPPLGVPRWPRARLGGGAAKKGLPKDAMAWWNRGAISAEAAGIASSARWPSLVAAHSRFASFGPGVELTFYEQRHAAAAHAKTIHVEADIPISQRDEFDRAMIETIAAGAAAHFAEARREGMGSILAD